ncbi:MAG TPA: sigma-70 family RNA polymerase sigma factor [Motilibacteraceae bacterium]|nr:sigma-70 family RNA polymerase sigma factor [Motilibacteraceae bacterium]
MPRTPSTTRSTTATSAPAATKGATRRPRVVVAGTPTRTGTVHPTTAGQAAAPLSAETTVREALAVDVVETGAVDVVATGTVTSGETSSDELDQPAPTADLVRVYLDEIGKTALLNAAEEVELSRRIEAGLYAERLLAAHADGEPLAAPGTPSREKVATTVALLEQVVAQGREAKARMVQANLRLVVSVARKYSQRGVPLLDVIQEGNVGLIRAVEKFDYRKGFKFSTYATWWIRQAISRGLVEQDRTIRLPVHVSEEVSKITRARRRLVQDLGREVTDAEIAEASGLPLERVTELRLVARDAVSLDSPVGDEEDTSLGDLVADTSTETVEDVVERTAMSEEIGRLLDGLDERERTVLRLRFGLDDGRPRTLDEIGRVIGLTRERVRQIEKGVLLRLRQPGAADSLLPFAS